MSDNIQWDNYHWSESSESGLFDKNKKKITGKISEIRIKDYGLASISGGSGALCEVTVKVEDPLGNKVSAKSVGEDIVTTSVKAVIDAINRIMLKKMVNEKPVNKS